MEHRRRAVIYLRIGRDEEAQRACCLRYIEDCGYLIAAVASDVPGARSGWIDAVRTVESRYADVVVVARRSLIPGMVPVEEAAAAPDDPRRPHRLDT